MSTIAKVAAVGAIVAIQSLGVTEARQLKAGSAITMTPAQSKFASNLLGYSNVASKVEYEPDVLDFFELETEALCADIQKVETECTEVRFARGTTLGELCVDGEFVLAGIRDCVVTACGGDFTCEASEALTTILEGKLDFDTLGLCAPPAAGVCASVGTAADPIGKGSGCTFDKFDAGIGPCAEEVFILKGFDLEPQFKNCDELETAVGRFKECAEDLCGKDCANDRLVKASSFATFVLGASAFECEVGVNQDVCLFSAAPSAASVGMLSAAIALLAAWFNN